MKNIKFHHFSLKVSTTVKIAVQCLENFGGCKYPPPWLRAWSLATRGCVAGLGQWIIVTQMWTQRW